MKALNAVLLILLASLIVSCKKTTESPEQLKIIETITSQVPDQIDFQNIGDKTWTKVCFFGPYTLKSSDVLGFHWDVTKQTDVTADDTINAIVFATDKQVTEYVVIKRSKGDFWKLSRQCFPRSEAKFVYAAPVWSYQHHKLIN